MNGATSECSFPAAPTSQITVSCTPRSAIVATASVTIEANSHRPKRSVPSPFSISGTRTIATRARRSLLPPLMSPWPISRIGSEVPAVAERGAGLISGRSAIASADAGMLVATQFARMPQDRLGSGRRNGVHDNRVTGAQRHPAQFNGQGKIAYSMVRPDSRGMHPVKIRAQRVKTWLVAHCHLEQSPHAVQNRVIHGTAGI